MSNWNDGWVTGFIAASYLFAGYYDDYAELRDERFACRDTESRKPEPLPPNDDAKVDRT